MGEQHAAVEARIREAATGNNWRAAAAGVFEGYGDEILGYLVAVMRSETDAEDAFSMFCESVCMALPQFRWESTARTWAYSLARNAAYRLRRDPHRRRVIPLADQHLEEIAAQLRSRTASYLRTEMRDKIAKLRASLDPDDQTLLILRLSRGLTWREIARVLAAEGESSTDAALDKLTASLRKRFERLKAEIKERARSLED